MNNAEPTLRRRAKYLLKQLSDNRPRRALDLDATRHLLQAIAQPADEDQLITDLIRAAWDWGVSCEIDDVRWGEEGDSHNQMLRDRTQALATRLQVAAAPAPNDWQSVHERINATAQHLPEQIKALLRVLPSMTSYLAEQKCSAGVVAHGLEGEVESWEVALTGFATYLRDVLGSR